jgi:hypothetical protein
LIAGKDLGVANQATIISIKVGGMLNTRVIVLLKGFSQVTDTELATKTAVYWAISQAIAHYKTVRGGKGGTIINISISTTYHPDQDEAFAAVTDLATQRWLSLIRI